MSFDGVRTICGRIRMYTSVRTGVFATEEGSRVVDAIARGEPPEAADVRFVLGAFATSMTPTEFVERARSLALAKVTPDTEFALMDGLRDMVRSPASQGDERRVTRRSRREGAPSPTVISATTEAGSVFSQQSFVRRMRQPR